MSKHVAVYIIQRDTVMIYNCAFVGCNKNNKRCTVHVLKQCIQYVYLKYSNTEIPPNKFDINHKTKI